MSFKLKKEIYGNSVWMVDHRSIDGMMSLLSDFKKGVVYNGDEHDKCNSSFLMSIQNANIVDSNSSKSDQESDLVGVINLDGPITKNGGMSSYGTKEQSKQLERFENDDRVKGTIINADSGGGSGEAIQFMTDAMRAAKKPIVAFIEKGAMAASAAYGIISAADFIMVENEDVEVGSLGTFMQFGGYPKDNTDSDGYRNVRIYATKSTKKNFNYEEAINNANFTPVIDNILNPANEKFLNNIKENRPSMTDVFMKGDMFKAKEVMGTMVDSVGSFNDAVNKVLELSNNKSTSNTNINNKQMNKSELQSNHSELHSEVFNDGVLAERERVGSWMAHSQTDFEAVQEGIESGKELSPSQREKFLVKQNNQNAVAGMKSESAANLKGVKKTETKSAEEIEQAQSNAEVEDFYKDI